MKNTRNIVIRENSLERVVIGIDDAIQAVITFNDVSQQVTRVKCEIEPIEEE